MVDRLNRTATAALLSALETVVAEPENDLRTVAASRVPDLKLDTSGGRTEVVCLSAMTEDFPRAAALLAGLRSRFGRTFVAICGGPHATADPEGVLAAGFDICCVGEGETAMRDLACRPGDLASCLAGNHPGGSAGRVVRGRPAGLDDFPPLPAVVRFRAYIEIGRGCRWGCAYCQTPRIFGHAERFRSPAAVESTIARYAAGGMKDFRLLLPNALGYGSSTPGEPNCEMLEELLRRATLAAGVGRVFLGSFPSEMRPDYVTPEAVGILKRYVSNRQVVIGAQSGSRRLLDVLRRGHSADLIEEACRVVAGHGFLPTVDLMFGFPAEEPADREATFDLAERLRRARAIINMHFFMPLPGTPLAGAVPRFLKASERDRLEELAWKGVIRGRWRRQEEIAQEWSSGRPGTGPSPSGSSAD